VTKVFENNFIKEIKDGEGKGVDDEGKNKKHL